MKLIVQNFKNGNKNYWIILILEQCPLDCINSYYKISVYYNLQKYFVKNDFLDRLLK